MFDIFNHLSSNFNLSNVFCFSKLSPKSSDIHISDLHLEDKSLCCFNNITSWHSIFQPCQLLVLALLSCSESPIFNIIRYVFFIIVHFTGCIERHCPGIVLYSSCNWCLYFMHNLCLFEVSKNYLSFFYYSSLLFTSQVVGNSHVRWFVVSIVSL